MTTWNSINRMVDVTDQTITLAARSSVPAPGDVMSPEDLTPDERRRVRATLRKKFVTAARPQVIDVTLGAALKQAEGRSDPQRVWAACFHVRKKLARPSSDARLPREVTVRVRRGGHFETLTLPTDVIDLSGLTATGTDLLMPRVSADPVASVPATGGLLFEWLVPSAVGPIPFQGLLTVGHSCDPPEAFGPSGGPVAIRTPAGLKSGRLFARSMFRIDAALSTADRSNLVIPQLHPIRPLAAIEHDKDRPGRSLRADGAVPFVVSSPPQNQVLPDPWNGSQQNLVRVESPVTDAFAPGTSGSVWVIDDPATGPQAAMIQLAAFDNGFRIGLGQVIDLTLLPWALARIAARPGVDPDSIKVAGGF
jgi:hypothetical protein